MKFFIAKVMPLYRCKAPVLGLFVSFLGVLAKTSTTFNRLCSAALRPLRDRNIKQRGSSEWSLARDVYVARDLSIYIICKMRCAILQISDSNPDPNPYPSQIAQRILQIAQTHKC